MGRDSLTGGSVASMFQENKGQFKGTGTLGGGGDTQAPTAPSNLALSNVAAVSRSNSFAGFVLFHSSNESLNRFR